MRTLFLLICVIVWGIFASIFICYGFRWHYIDSYEAELAKIKESEAYKAQDAELTRGVETFGEDEDAGMAQADKALDGIIRLKKEIEPLKWKFEFYDRWMCYAAAIICLFLAVARAPAGSSLWIPWLWAAGFFWIFGLGNVFCSTVGN